jgi:hypothetical protein
MGLLCAPMVLSALRKARKHAVSVLGSENCAYLYGNFAVTVAAKLPVLFYFQNHVNCLHVALFLRIKRFY